MKLREHSVKQALEALSWPTLKAALDPVPFDAAVADELAGLVLRSTGLLIKRPDQKRTAARGRLFEQILQYAEQRGGQECAAKLRNAFQTMEMIDQGYLGILEMLDRCDVSKLPPAERAAACIERTAIEYADVVKRTDEAVLSLPEFFDPNNPVLQGEEGITFTPDGATSMLVETLTMSLVMESYHNKWFSKDGHVVIPKWEPANDQKRYMAGSTAVLAAFWRIWQRIEERRRYFGGSLRRYVPPERPEGLPADFPADATVVVLQPDMEWEAIDFIANERLNAVLFQNYMRLLHMTNAFSNEAGIEKQAPLLPDAFVCVAEAHGGAALSELLGFAIHEDQERYAGLRLVEWLRGFSVLQCIVDAAWDEAKGDWKALVHFMKRADLAARLECLGLPAEAAVQFIAHATLRRASRDLFDCPLIAVGDEDLILFTPAIRSGNLTRVVLSALSSLGVSVSRKGPAFEQHLRTFLAKQGLICKAFKATRDGEEYEYDAVLLWGDFLFVFECKSHSLSNWSPPASYYFRLETKSHVSQVKRLVGALAKVSGHPRISFRCRSKGQEDRAVPRERHALQRAGRGRWRLFHRHVGHDAFLRGPALEADSPA